MIELRNLSKQFETADGSVDALKHINLTIQNGDIYGIIGMSGAGKSTLVRCIICWKNLPKAVFIGMKKTWAPCRRRNSGQCAAGSL